MKPRILPIVPFCPDGEGHRPGEDIGLAYNLAMKEIPNPNAWVCIMDGDIHHTTRVWFRILEMVIQLKPDAGAFVGVCNRLVKEKSGWQMALEMDRDNNNIVDHWKMGNHRYKTHGTKLVDVTFIDQETSYKPLSGFLFMLQRRTWDLIGGAPEQKSMSHVDYEIHRRLRAHGKRIYMMPGLYVYHWSKYDRSLSDPYMKPA